MSSVPYRTPPVFQLSFDLPQVDLLSSIQLSEDLESQQRHTLQIVFQGLSTKKHSLKGIFFKCLPKINDAYN